MLELSHGLCKSSRRGTDRIADFFFFLKQSFAAVVGGVKRAPSSLPCTLFFFFFPFGPSIADPHGEKEGVWRGCSAILSFDVVGT